MDSEVWAQIRAAQRSESSPAGSSSWDAWKPNARRKATLSEGSGTVYLLVEHMSENLVAQDIECAGVGIGWVKGGSSRDKETEYAMFFNRSRNLPIVEGPRRRRRRRLTGLPLAKVVGQSAKRSHTGSVSRIGMHSGCSSWDVWPAAMICGVFGFKCVGCKGGRCVVCLLPYLQGCYSCDNRTFSAAGCTW